MDNGVPPINRRTASRLVSRSANQPTDPRTEGSNGPNGAKPSNGSVAGNGTAGASGRARSASSKKGAEKTRRTQSTAAVIAGEHDALVIEPATAEPQLSSAPEADAAVVEALVADTAVRDLAADDARTPLLLPPIVPGEPDTLPSTEAVPTTDLVPPTMAVPLVPAAESTDTDGTDGLPSLARPKKPMRPLRKPVMVPRHRPRVRRVTRVVRHVDSWSIFKVAVVFNLFLYAVCLTAGVLLWQVAQNTGTVDNIERFFESFGWERFELKGGEIYHSAWVAGLFVVVGLTGLAVLMATLFNLITDLVGGIRVSVLEEEVVVREDRGLGWRRGTRKPRVQTVATDVPAGPEQAEAGEPS